MGPARRRGGVSGWGGLFKGEIPGWDGLCHRIWSRIGGVFFIFSKEELKKYEGDITENHEKRDIGGRALFENA